MIHFQPAMRRATLLVSSLIAFGCAAPAGQTMSSADSQAIRADVERALREAYDLAKPGVAERMLSLYPPSGPIVSAAGGKVIGSRDSLAAGIRYFWNNVGTNMRGAQWIWGQFHVDVLSPTAAVATATYRIPHRDPRNMPHELAGAMTEVMEKRNGKWVIVQEHLSDLPVPDSISTSIQTHENQ